MSTGLMLDARTLTSPSPCPGRGMATVWSSSASGPPKRWMRNARIVLGTSATPCSGEPRDADTVSDTVMLRSSSCSLQHDLGPAGLALVEVLIALRRLFERQFMRDDLRRLDLACRNQIAKLAVIRLHVRLARRHVLAFHPELAEVECELPFLHQVVGLTGVFGYEYTYFADL